VTSSKRINVNSPSGAEAVVPHSRLQASDFDLSSIDIYINSVCNRRCSYCFLPDEFFSAKHQISLETVGGIIDWCQGAVTEVTLLGGEPSLHPQLFDIAELVATAGLELRIVTNGARRLLRLLESRSFVSFLTSAAVSLDHFEPDVVNALRGSGAFNDAMRTVERLAEQRVPFSINCTVTSLLENDVGKMIEFAEGLGAYRLNLHWLSSVGRGRRRPDLAVDAMRWKAVLDLLGEYAAPRSDYIVDCEAGWLYPNARSSVDPFECAVQARKNLQFMPDGRVFACGLLVESDELHGYEWSRDGLCLHVGDRTEVMVARERDGCSFCPVRTLIDDYRRPEDGDLLPACIYQRMRVVSPSTHSR
jgi:MoaA/NifB/PqqE/SkfB family radical SAM enzyme